MSEGPGRTDAVEAPATARGPARERPRRRRRWPWLLLGAGLALVVLARVALPAAVERGAAWGSRRYLGLPASVANADFELLAGRVVLEGVVLGARADGVSPRDAALGPPALDPAEALVSVRRVAGRIAWRDLVDRTLRLTELSVEAPVVRALREADGRVDPLRYARPTAAAPETAAAQPGAEGPGWTIALDRFDLLAPDVRVVDAPSGGSVVELSLERFGLERVSLRGGALELGGVGLEGPVLRVRRDLLLAQRAAVPREPAAPPEPPVAKPPAAEPPAAEPPAADAPAEADPAAGAAARDAAPPAAAAARSARAAYRVAKLDVRRATFTWVTESGPLDVSVALEATDVTAEEGRRFPFELELEVGDGTMRVSGEAGLLPPVWTGKLVWSGLPIPRLLVASVPQFAGWLRQAESSGDLAIDADFAGARGEPSTRASGRLSFDALAVADPQGSEVTLGWKQLEVVLRDVYAPLPLEGRPLGTTRALLGSVKLVEPEIRYTRPSPQLDALLGIDLSGAGAAGAGPAETALPPPLATDSPARAPLELEVDSLELTGGEVEALDRTVTPAARTRVRGLSLRAKDVRYPATAAAQVRLGATLPTRARLDVAGSLRPGNLGDFTLKLGRLDLPVFNPYASAAAGATVDRGSASVDARLALRGAAMRLDSRLVLHGFGVSLRDPETFERSFGLPLDLALALLRDRQGDIELRVPVAVDEKGATLGLRTVVASALWAAVLGAVSSPLKLIGAVGVGGEGGAADGLSIEPLPSVAGAPALEGAPDERLDGLAELAGQRPAVRLSLRGRAGAADRPIVAEQLLVERRQRGEGLPELEGTSLLSRRRIGAALERRAAGADTGLDAEDQALYERYVAAVTVPEERLAALASERAALVREQLVARGVAAAQLELREPDTDAAPGVAIALGAGG